MARTKTKAIDKLEENIYKKEYLEPTEKLNAKEKKLFKKIVESMKPSYFIAADELLIVELIKLKLTSDTAYTQLKNFDDMASAEATKLVNIMGKAAGISSTISQKLGISPSSRVRHTKKTNTLDDIVDEIDEMLD